MKHPVLRVKKGSGSYDDRPDHLVEQRAAEVREKRRPKIEKKRGLLWFLRMRRGSLLPVLILVLVALMLLRALPRSAQRANIGGWHAVLQARAFEGSLLVGVAFSRRGGREGALASVLFELPDTGEQAGAQGLLEQSRSVLRARMHHTGVEKVLRAIVTVDGQRQTLSLSLPGP